ncbi:TspO/MBR family protein [Nocardiopsis xinjiangensis]|uniref:TspO/MBR family protein n=1 Tax=Nocardiopsis xinjiangensis TaxID=124285 RepID=UPI000367095C|nr:TspO/MBR family protein [Nocardiopsis xinjiangensis]
MPDTQQEPRTGARSLLVLLGFALAVAAAAAIGGVASSTAGDVYGQLEQPGWAPPSWLFSPVWTVLYVLIAVAGWLVWRRAGWSGARVAMTLFLVQLVLNAAWPPLFFAAEMRLAAFIEIIVLLAVITAMIAAFARISRTAAVLMAPYWVWVAYASALNFSLWQLNPGG